jgi:hypothetical protein
MVLKWFHVPLLLLVLRLFLHSTCCALVLWGLNILESSRFFSWTHFCYGCRIVSTFGTMKVVRSSPLRTGRPPSSPGSSWYSVLEAESTPGHMELSKFPEKSPVKAPGIDPGTHRLVAQHLNHYATPHTPTYIYIHTYTYMYIHKQARASNRTFTYIYVYIGLDTQVFRRDNLGRKFQLSLHVTSSTRWSRFFLLPSSSIWYLLTSAV